MGGRESSSVSAGGASAGGRSKRVLYEVGKRSDALGAATGPTDEVNARKNLEMAARHADVSTGRLESRIADVEKAMRRQDEAILMNMGY